MIGTIRDGDADDETSLYHPAMGVDQGLLLAEQGLIGLEPTGKVLVNRRPHQGLEAGKEVVVTTDQGPNFEAPKVSGAPLQEFGPFHSQSEQTGNGMGCHGYRLTFRADLTKTLILNDI
jgi:hypothetical protein